MSMSDREIMRFRNRRFPIPMRGNEKGEGRRDHDCYEFPIPMRGNETGTPTAVHATREVPDPHEG